MMKFDRDTIENAIVKEFSKCVKYADDDENECHWRKLQRLEKEAYNFDVAA